MIYRYLKRGLVAGSLAGVIYGLLIGVAMNPLIRTIEHAQHGHTHGTESSAAVAQSTTELLGIGGGMVWAVFLGGLFGVAYYFLEPVLPGRPRVKGIVLAGVGFLTLSGLPWLVLPPFAPGATHRYSASTRFAIYIALVALGVAVAAAGILGYNVLSERHRFAGTVAGLLPVAAVCIVVPTVAPTAIMHPDLAKSLVVRYQMLVVTGQVSVWLLIGATFTQMRTPDELTGFHYS